MEDIYFDTLIWKEGNVYVSYCPQFDVSSCGDTIEEGVYYARIVLQIHESGDNSFYGVSLDDQG